MFFPRKKGQNCTGNSNISERLEESKTGLKKTDG